MEQVGETKEVTIWSFPAEPQTYTDTLVVTVKDNPSPYRFDLSASGVVPTVQLGGEWTAKAAQQRALAETLPEATEPVPEV